MHKQLTILALLLSAAPLLAQNDRVMTVAPVYRSYGTPRARTFLPHGWLRGFTQFEGAPPTNEPDLDRCGSINFQLGASTHCTAYARYMASAYVEIQPLGRTPLRHFFAFYEPRMSFGRNVPQRVYTSSFAPMAYERIWGVGYELPKNFELRVVQHQVTWLGQYRHNLGPADIGKNGPYGLYSTVGLRWYFGGYGRAHGSIQN